MSAALVPVWRRYVGAEPSRPSAFVQRLVRDRSGRLAWFYESVAHLDPARQRLALAAAEPAGARVERARDLLQIFETCSPEWQIADRPFTRPNVDPSLVLEIVVNLVRRPKASLLPGGGK